MPRLLAALGLLALVAVAGWFVLDGGGGAVEEVAAPGASAAESTARADAALDADEGAAVEEREPDAPSELGANEANRTSLGATDLRLVAERYGSIAGTVRADFDLQRYTL